MEYTRRRLVSGAVGVASAGLLAGCLDDSADGPGRGSETPTARASFFVFGDVTSNVAGNAATAELLVPVGQHGHGWEPGPRVREDIHEADVLVHGPEGFQPWVDDIIPDLEADGSGVATVDASAEVDLLEAGGSHDHDDDDNDGEHDDHDDDDHDDDDGEHGDESGVDPHFWMDPLRVKEAVGTVRDGLADVDPDGEDAYADNAENYRSRLDDLHGQIESTIDDGTNDVLLVAGHDAFQYFADRYDVEVIALTNVSPDDRETLRDNERAQEAIETHGLQYVCADPLESQEAAEQLVEETDAEAVLPLTSIPGLTREWEENDWGYVEVVKNVNLPTLERALDV